MNAEWVQVHLPYVLSTTNTYKFYIETNTIIFDWKLSSSTDGITFIDEYNNSTNYIQRSKIFRDTFSITQEDVYILRFSVLDALEFINEIKEITFYKVLEDGQLQKINPNFITNSQNLTFPSIPSSLVGEFKVTTPIGSLGPANLFDLLKETVYRSDICFDVLGNYTGTDFVNYETTTYYGTYIDLEFPYNINFDSYSIISSNNIYKFPNKWILLGSIDGFTYEIIDQQELNNIVTEYTCYSYTITSNTDFIKIKFLVLSTFGSVETEFCEFSINSAVSGGRIIPVILQPITQENTVVFGSRLGNAVDVYSGLNVDTPEWLRIKFPFYPGDVGRIVLYGNYLPADIDLKNNTSGALIASVYGNFSVTGSVTISKIDNSRRTEDFYFEFKRLQPNTDGYSFIQISNIVFYDELVNRMNFIWNPVINYSTRINVDTLEVNGQKTIPGGQYIGNTRSKLTDNTFVYGEYYEIVYDTPTNIQGISVDTDAFEWTVLGSNNRATWERIYTMNKYNNVPSIPINNYTPVDEFSIQFTDKNTTYELRTPESNIAIQNLLKLDAYQELFLPPNGTVDENGFTIWYNGISPQYGFTGRSPKYYTRLPGLIPSSYDSTLQADYTFNEEFGNQFVPKAIDGVYGEYFEYVFPKATQWKGVKIFTSRYGNINVYTPRWVFFFGSQDGENWEMFTRPENYTYPFEEFASVPKDEYTYVFDNYDTYYIHYRIVVASAGTGTIRIGSIQWIGNEDIHQIFKTRNINENYKNYRLVITSSNTTSYAVVNDFSLLNEYGDILENQYSGGKYTGSNVLVQGYQGDYRIISYENPMYISYANVNSSSNIWKVHSAYSDDGTTWNILSTKEDDRLEGTYLCESPMIGNFQPLLPQLYSAVVICPGPTQLYSFSFHTADLTLNHNASIPREFIMEGSNDELSWETIQMYNESLQYNTEFTFQMNPVIPYVYYKLSFLSYNVTTRTRLSVYNYQLYSKLGLPVLGKQVIKRDASKNIPIQKESKNFALIFEEIYSPDGNLNIDSIILS